MTSLHFYLPFSDRWVRCCTTRCGRRHATSCLSSLLWCSSSRGSMFFQAGKKLLNQTYFHMLVCKCPTRFDVQFVFPTASFPLSVRHTLLWSSRVCRNSWFQPLCVCVCFPGSSTPPWSFQWSSSSPSLVIISSTLFCSCYKRCTSTGPISSCAWSTGLPSWARWDEGLFNEAAIGGNEGGIGWLTLLFFSTDRGWCSQRWGESGRWQWWRGRWGWVQLGAEEGCD